MTIGSKINSAYFKGLVDDIRIYNRTLTQTEVNEKKNRSISKTEKGLVACFKMDEGLGNKTFDTSTLPTSDFEPGSNITLKPVYKDHTFTPENIQYRKLQAPRAGIVFLDNTKRTISGQVAGGLCKKSIMPAGSRMVFLSLKTAPFKLALFVLS